jgi:hypothetical protein
MGGGGGTWAEFRMGCESFFYKGPQDSYSLQFSVVVDPDPHCVGSRGSGSVLVKRKNLTFCDGQYGQDPDPHWFGFLDPDPHRGKNLVPDPN